MTRRQEGYTLIEVLMSVAVFTVLVAASGQMFVGISRLFAVANHATQVVEDIDDVGEELKSLARQAQGLRQSAGAYTAGESLAIFALDDGRFALLGHLGAAEERPVAAIVNESGETEYFKRFSKQIVGVSFSCEGRRIVMRVHADNLGMENTVPRDSSFISALRANGAHAHGTTGS